MEILALSLKAVVYRIAINARFFFRIRPSKKLFEKWYNLVSTLVHKLFSNFSCMNYGYSGERLIGLKPEDESERYCLQLYHNTATGADSVSLKGRDVLEIGCGRGGGASYVARYLGAAKVTGLDLSSKAIAYCRSHHKPGNLEFIQGDSENLPFDDNSIDAVVNLESAHCYPSFPRFLSEVKRVLKPGGHFLFADYRYADLIPVMKTAVEECGLAVKSETDITANVVASLDTDSPRRDGIISGSRIPGFVRKYLRHFAGVSGSLMYREFASRKKIYLSYVLEKQ